VKPTVTVPADITVDGAGAEGMSLAYVTTFADATSGIATKGCTPASGSSFPSGVTKVTCTATDKAGNEETGAFTVTVTAQTAKAAREAKQAVLASLRDELVCTTRRDLRDRLSDAIRHLQASLAPGLWVTSGPLDDGNHLDAARGEKVFEAEKAAVTSLMRIRRPSPAVQAAIVTLDAADRLLAQTAIDDATAAGVDPERLAAAGREMASAEGHLSRGGFDHAIDHWKDAWRGVTLLPPTPGESCTH
jgi:hypothetical protein